MLWQDLVKNALLGVENSSFNQPTLDGLAELGVDTNREAPLLLGDGAALMAQLRRAGFLLHDFSGEMPTPQSEISANPTSLKTAHHLSLILAGPQLLVLPEFLVLLKKTGKHLPTSEIPALMKLPDLPQLWPQVEPLLDEPGRWLLRQHPVWSAYLIDPKQSNWQTGSRTERLALLRFWRGESPNFALELLTATWGSESHTDKAAFLALLEVGLSIADEPFLERCLEDRRKEVRQVAAPLLAKIPGSLMAQRMAKRAADCLTWKGISLKINIPEAPDEAAQRDGILKIHPGWAGGAKAGQLGQIMALVPPPHWEAYFEKTPTELLDLFSKTDWGETLLRGCLEATVFHQNPVWAAALFEFWQRNEHLRIWELPVTNNLPKLLAPTEAARLSLYFLKAATNLPNEASPLFRLLKNHEAAWPDELSFLIVSRFRTEIVKDYRQIWQLQHLSGYLQMLGLRCDPALFDQLQSGWSNDSVQWRMWERPVEEMLTRVLFRREIREEMAKG